MYEQIEKPKKSESRAVANSAAHMENKVKQNIGFVDNRSGVVAQRKLQEIFSNYSIQQQPIQRMGSITQFKLREEDSKVIWDFLTLNFTGSDADFVISKSEIHRIYNVVSEAASNRNQGLKMAMRAVKKLYKQMEAERELDEIHGYSGKNGCDLEIQQYDELDTLIRAYNLILNHDVTRGTDDAETTQIGMSLGQLIKYIEENELRYMLDEVICPGSNKATKPYQGFPFMQIIKKAESGIDCHNAYADALLECLYTLKRY